MKYIIDRFKTTDGKTFKLIKKTNEEFQIVRNKFIFHTCETIEMATMKFYKIKELFRIEGQIYEKISLH